MGFQHSAFIAFEGGGDESKLLITGGEEFEQFTRFLASRQILVVDYETTGLAWYQGARSVGIALGAWDDQGCFRSCYVPYRHSTFEKQLELHRIHARIGELLSNPQVLKIAHNIKFEDHFSRVEGWTLDGPRYDTMVAAHLFDENRPMVLEYRVGTDAGLGDSAKEAKGAIQRCLKELAKDRKMGVKAYVNAFGYQELPIDLAGYYACCDVEYAGRLYCAYEAWGLSRIYGELWQTEMDLTRSLCDMEQSGLPLDVEYLDKLSQKCFAEMHEKEQAISDALHGHMFDLGSDDQLRDFMVKILGLHWDKKTDKDKLSVDAEVLEQFAPQFSILQWVLDWREHQKIQSTYTTSLIDRCDSKNVLHGDLKQAGTKTGRLSCLAGDMVLETSRGAFPIGEYVWQEGDLIRTHKGRLRKIVRKFVQGVDFVFRVGLDSGQTIKCTRDHRLLTPDGWCQLGDLAVGSEVYCVDQQVVSAGSSCDQGGSGSVFESRGKTDNGAYGGIVGRNTSYRRHDTQGTRGPGEIDLREAASLFTQQVGGKKSGAGDDGGEVASLERGLPRSQRLPDTAGREETLFRTQDSDGRCVGHSPGGASQRVGGTPHRWGSTKQYDKQSLPLYSEGAFRVTSKAVKIREITPLGTMEVYDIEVADDHSYWAEGFCSHNCEKPNYQNIESGPRVRTAFMVPAGKVRILLDFSQIELRILAHYSQDPIMVDTYINNGDIHERTRAEVEGLLQKPVERRTAKVVNFGLAFGLTDRGLSRQAKMPLDEATEFLAKFFERYQGVVRFQDQIVRQAVAQSGQWTNMYGRTRRIEDLLAHEDWKKRSGKRRMVGSAIQGTAAQLIKISIVRISKFFREENIPAEMVNTVHDEIQIDVPKEWAVYVYQKCKALMEDFPEFHPIPIIADGEATDTNWGAKVGFSDFCKERGIAFKESGR